MGRSNLSREKREEAYKLAQTALQMHWKNPLPKDSDWDGIEDWDDGELEQHTRDAVSQLRWERYYVPAMSVGLAVAGMYLFFWVLNLLRG